MYFSCVIFKSSSLAFLSSISLSYFSASSSHALFTQFLANSFALVDVTDVSNVKFRKIDYPFLAWTKVKLHFYIPPQTKLLAELNGKVIDQRKVNNVNGTIIKISDIFHRKLHKLEDYLEEKNHLIDKKI